MSIGSKSHKIIPMIRSPVQRLVSRLGSHHFERDIRRHFTAQREAPSYLRWLRWREVFSSPTGATTQCPLHCGVSFVAVLVSFEPLLCCWNLQYLGLLQVGKSMCAVTGYLTRILHFSIIFSDILKEICAPQMALRYLCGRNWQEM